VTNKMSKQSKDTGNNWYIVYYHWVSGNRVRHDHRKVLAKDAQEAKVGLIRGMKAGYGRLIAVDKVKRTKMDLVIPKRKPVVSKKTPRITRKRPRIG